jgi:hypothetical protein
MSHDVTIYRCFPSVIIYVVIDICYMLYWEDHKDIVSINCVLHGCLIHYVNSGIFMMPMLLSECPHSKSYITSGIISCPCHTLLK